MTFQVRKLDYWGGLDRWAVFKLGLDQRWVCVSRHYRKQIEAERDMVKRKAHHERYADDSPSDNRIPAR